MPIEILMPALSPTMEEGTLSKWLVKEGDTIRSGDVLAEIETDKATMEIEAVEEGTIARILVKDATDNVRVNAPIAILLEEDEDDSALEGYEIGGDDSSFSPQAGGSTPEGGDGGQASTQSKTKEKTDDRPPSTSAKAEPTSPRGRGEERDGDRIFASPLAKRMAEQDGLDLSAISGSGPNGRIVKSDIEAAKKDGAGIAAPKVAAEAAPKTTPETTTTEVGMPRGDGPQYLEKMGVVPGSYDFVPLTGINKVVAKRLSASHENVPDFPLMIDCEIDALLAMRKELNGQAPEGVKVSVNDMLIRASALALKQVPSANASYTPDGVAMHHHADVAVAVAIDGGLITPIVREAENKGLAIISTEMKDLAERAKSMKLKPQEYQGGTFSISNLGMMGIKSFGSIINEPHGMILSVGAGSPQPVVKDGALAVATVMTVTLTCDHRVVDGALGARWLAAFKRYVEQPITMML